MSRLARFNLTSIIASILLVCSLTCLQRPLQAAEPARPNVILVLTDDQGYGDLSCLGNPVLQTPNLDRLFAESVRLTDFHVSPMCTPTRAELMTGCDTLRTAAMNVSSGRTLLRTDLPTMASVFSESGYRTGMFGKWHLGDAYPYRPQDRGFQQVVWFPSSHIGSVPDAWNNDYFNDRYRTNHGEQSFSGYCTDVFFDQAIQWIRDNRTQAQPFFVYLPLNAAHWPHFVPEKYRLLYEKKLADTPGTAARKEALARFFGMIANIDENMGRLESVLQETGLRENTILIFLSDNGGTVGVPFYNAGMKGSKVTLWEGGHRVPCFIRWPAGHVSGGRDVTPLTECQDLLPTLVDLCQLRPPASAKFDGISLAATLQAKATVPDDRMLVVQFSRMNAPRPKQGDAAILWQRWRMRGDGELYDLRSDPHQDKNVIKGHPEIAKRMREHYAQWWQEIEPTLDTFQPSYIGAEQENPTMLTACEWADVFLDQSLQVRRGERKNGLWHIVVARPGQYDFRLRRWPEDVDVPVSASLPAHDGEDGDYPPGVALPIAAARMSVGSHSVETKLGASDREARFVVKLPAGRTTLQTWWLDSNQQEICGAYYVYARYLGPLEQ